MRDVSWIHNGQPLTSQYLEDLACAYWQSDSLFAALELGLFTHLEEARQTADLARVADCREAPLRRLLAALARLGLIDEGDGAWRNRPLASRHLRPGTPGYLGDFLLYRRYLQAPWQSLAATVAGRPLTAGLSRQDDYQSRTLHYVRALDQLARLKAAEIAAALADTVWSGPLLDLGGGAGALCRALRRDEAATLFELPEVLAAAHQLYPLATDWQGISEIGGDFREALPRGQQFGLILLANVLHTYDEAEAKALVAQVGDLLPAGGLLLVHEYFPDRSPLKGTLYDLNMMLNTPRGICHEARMIGDWLSEAGLVAPRILALDSDSGILLARRPPC